MPATADLATATPVQVDTAISEIYTRYYKECDVIEKFDRWIEDYEKGLAKKALTPGRGPYSDWSEERLNDLLDQRDVHRANASAIMAESFPLQAEYRRRRWTRFFLVQNNGGHIHKDMDCSTCNNGKRATRFGWLPEFSGQTEAEAVAKHGAILCTVCYPSAPAEWTDRRDDSVCPGSGKYFNSSLPHRGPHFYSGNWATCETCGTTQTMVKSGKIRKHKKA
jgi:hypothetical protein